MPGWPRPARTVASRSKRSTSMGSSAWRILSATVPPWSRSTARYTVPIPPEPAVLWISKRCATIVPSGRAILAIVSDRALEKGRDGTHRGSAGRRAAGEVPAGRILTGAGPDRDPQEAHLGAGAEDLDRAAVEEARERLGARPLLQQRQAAADEV